MTTAIAYHTTTDNSDAVSAWLAARKEAGAKADAWLVEFDRQHPTPSGARRELLGSAFGADDAQVRGVTAERGETPPRGWRNDPRGRPAWVPDQRYRAGKDALAEFKGLTLPGLSKLLDQLGMPSLIDLPGKWVSPGAHIDDGLVIVTWGDERAAEKVQQEMERAGKASGWRRMPLSEYHAWAEARDAA